MFGFDGQECLLPGEFHGQKNLTGYSPCSHRESDMIEQLTYSRGFPGGTDRKESSCRDWGLIYRRLWFDPWNRKIPWRREWLPTPVFSSGA